MESFNAGYVLFQNEHRYGKCPSKEDQTSHDRLRTLLFQYALAQRIIVHFLGHPMQPLDMLSFY